MLKEIAIITNKATLAVANLMFLFFIEIFNALFYINIIKTYGMFLAAVLSDLIFIICGGFRKKDYLIRSLLTSN
jgi:hypothetical protein